MDGLEFYCVRMEYLVKPYDNVPSWLLNQIVERHYAVEELSGSIRSYHYTNDKVTIRTNIGDIDVRNGDTIVKLPNNSIYAFKKGDGELLHELLKK